MWVLCLLLSIPLEKVPVPARVELFEGRLTQQGGVLGFAQGTLYHWNGEGALVRTLQVEDRILAADFNGLQYRLALARFFTGYKGQQTFEFYTLFYDAKGELIGRDADGARYFLDVDGWTFGPLNVFTPKRMHDPEYSPFLARQILFGDPASGHGLEEGSLRFFRLPALMRAHHLDFKRIFISADQKITPSPQGFLDNGGEFWVIYELQATVFRYNKATIHQELIDEHAQIPTTELKLPGFVKPIEKTFITDRPMPLDEFRSIRLENYKQWSRILWFGRYRDAYAIAYSLPAGGHPKIRLALLSKELKVTSQKDVDESCLVLGNDKDEIVTLLPKVSGNDFKIQMDRHGL